MTNNVVFNYRTIRWLVGLIAFLIPIACMLQMYRIQENWAFPSSISVTYHLGAQDIFVGMLFVVGIFLISYNGHPGPAARSQLRTVFLQKLWDLGFYRFYKEKHLALLAGICAISVALFPTSFDKEWLTNNKLQLIDYPLLPLEKIEEKNLMICIDNTECHLSNSTLVSSVHLYSAIFLIAILFIFCVSFALRARRKLKPAVLKNAQARPHDIQKIRTRYWLYQISAVAMLLSVVVGGVLYNLNASKNWAMTLLEIGCLWGFALCWFTAGNGYFRASEEVENSISNQMTGEEIGGY